MSRSKGGDRERSARNYDAHNTEFALSLGSARYRGSFPLLSVKPPPSHISRRSIPTTLPLECYGASCVAASASSFPREPSSGYTPAVPLPPLSELSPFLLPPLGYTQDTSVARGNVASA